MSIDPLKKDGTAAIQPAQLPPAPQEVARDRDPGAEQLPGVQVLLSAGPDGRFSEKQIKDEQNNELAGSIRRSDRAMQTLGQKIDQLKTPLETIVKNFPPFSPEDKTRMKLLREHSSIRKEIDQLTFPPPPEVAEARKALAVPPPLDPDASDRQIADHLVKLDAFGAELSLQRAALASDTASFLQDGRFQRGFSPLLGARNANFEAFGSESDAVKKSAEVGRQFADSVRQGVTVDHSKFLKGMS